MKRRQAGNFNERVVKCCLKKYLLQPDLLPIIQERVSLVSRLSHRGSLFFNHYLLHCLERGLPLPDLKDQTLYQQCFTMGAAVITKTIGTLQEFYTTVEHLYPPPQRLTGDTDAIKYTSKQYMTNFHTYLKMTFQKRQKIFIYLWGGARGLSRDECFSVICEINGWDIRKYQSVMSAEITAFIQQQREVLGIKVNESVNKAWFKEHYQNIVCYQYMMLSFFLRSGRKGYNIAPIISIRNHFLRIDTGALYGLMRAGKLVPGGRETFYDMAEDHFRSVFAIDRINKHKELGCFVETDGISLCIHFHTPKVSNKNSHQELNTVHSPFGRVNRVIAIDPGRSNLTYGVEVLPDNSIKNYKLTKRQYYADSHFTKNKRKAEHWNKEIEPWLTELSKVTTHTYKVTEFENYLRTLLPMLPDLWNHYTQKHWGLLRMDNYIHKRKTLDKFFSSMWKTGEENPIIAYGAAKFNATSKYELSAPTTTLSKRCAEHYPVVFIDEFRTTKCCYRCGSELNVMQRDGREIRGLRCCSSSNCLKTRLISRDQNAALNILACYRAGENRPNHLCRKRSSATEG